MAFVKAFFPRDVTDRLRQLADALRRHKNADVDIAALQHALAFATHLWQTERLITLNNKRKDRWARLANKASRDLARAVKSVKELVYADDGLGNPDWKEILVDPLERVSVEIKDWGRPNPYSPTRKRGKRGRPTDHINKAHAALAKIGISKSDRIDLLNILGFRLPNTGS